jgi:lipoprotein NlpI
MRFGLIGAAVLAGTILAVADARAQLSSPQWTTCTGKAGVDWREQIKSCTILIASSFETADNRAIAYVRRGIAYNNLGEIDNAINDYGDAIKTRPNHAEAYYNRGNAYLSKGDNAKAITDFDSAIGLDIKNAAAYRSRGLAFLYSGNSSKALADIEEASKLNPHDPYSAIWADIVAQRAKAPSPLQQALSQLRSQTWPAPVIRMFLGQIKPDAVLGAANDPDTKKKEGEICEAQFYSGEWALRSGDKGEATRLFKLAANACPKDFLEWTAANAELKALGVAP